jgi:hypothetical protein
VRPTKTTYRLANGPKDYQRCHQFLKDQGQDELHLSWPTIMAIRDTQVIGCLGTDLSKDALVAGPLVISAEIRRPFIPMIRLIDAYEVVLTHAGISSYYFGVELPAQPAWLRLIESMGVMPYYQDQDAIWFHRQLKGG